MKKKARWPRVLLWVGCVLILFGIGGWFAANYAIDKVLDSLAENALEDMESSLDEIESEVTDPGSTGEAGSEEGADSAAASDPEGNSPSDGGSAPNAGEPVSSAVPDDGRTDRSAGSDAANPKPSTEQDAASDPGHSGKASSGSNQPAEQGDSASNSGGSGKPSASFDYSAQVTADKMAAVRDNISTKERARVLAILLAKLDLSDIKTMQQLASGGLSVAEKRKARDLMLEKLTPEEYNELIQIAKKYGLSQGKTYEQVIKEQEKR